MTEVLRRPCGETPCPGVGPSASAFIRALLTPRRGCTHPLQLCIQVGEQWDTLHLSAVLVGHFEDHSAPLLAFVVCLALVVNVLPALPL